MNDKESYKSLCIKWSIALFAMGVVTMFCNIVGYKGHFLDSLPGMLILCIISFLGLSAKHFIPLNLPAVTYIGIFRRLSLFLCPIFKISDILASTHIKETNMKKQSKKIVIAAVALVIAIVAMICIYQYFKPASTSAGKEVALTVVSEDESEKKYSVETDAKYLRGVMDETKGLTYSGTENDLGMMVDTVNGESALYETDHAYWAFYVNGEYCNYGIDDQPVEDGDEFKIVYTDAQ